VRPSLVKRGKLKGGQLLAQPVDEQLRHLVRSRTQLEHRNALGEWIDGHPEPQNLRVAAQACSQFIQLQMRDLEMAERALMQDLGIRSCLQQPVRDRRMPDPQNSLLYWLH
jgi:hypothetical protein